MKADKVQLGWKTRAGLIVIMLLATYIFFIQQRPFLEILIVTPIFAGVGIVGVVASWISQRLKGKQMTGTANEDGN